MSSFGKSQITEYSKWNSSKSYGYSMYDTITSFHINFPIDWISFYEWLYDN